MEPLVEPQFARVPPFRPQPDLNDLKKVLLHLERAERPVIVAGGGARWSGAGPELVALAEALSIPVATSLNGKDCIPASHALSVGVVGSYSRESANRVVAAADLVVFVGTAAGGMTTRVWTVPKIGVPAIQIDIDPETIGPNYPVKVGILGDAKVTLAALVKSASPVSHRARWLEQVKAICKEWKDKYRPALESDAAPIRPERICAELSRHVPEDAIVLSDTGHAGMWMGGMYDLRGRQSFLRSAGHLGWAFPAGLGAKCAAPERPVVTFTGDAGLWYHLGEIETAVRWNIAAVTVVNNNASGNQSKRGFDRAYGGEQTAQARELWTYRMVDLARVATDIGAFGIRVERPRDFSPALEKAIASGKPAIVDVVTDIEAIAPAAVSG
jgi:acetolactate synthase-1/2/3 large subunit